MSVDQKEIALFLTKVGYEMEMHCGSNPFIFENNTITLKGSPEKSVDLIFYVDKKPARNLERAELFVKILDEKTLPDPIVFSYSLIEIFNISCRSPFEHIDLPTIKDITTDDCVGEIRDLVKNALNPSKVDVYLKGIMNMEPIYNAIEKTRLYRYLKNKMTSNPSIQCQYWLGKEVCACFDIGSYPQKDVKIKHLNFVEAPDNPKCRLARFGKWYVSIEDVVDDEKGDYIKNTICYNGNEHVFGNQEFNVDFDITRFSELALSDMILFCQIQEVAEAFEFMLGAQPENDMVSDWYEDWTDAFTEKERALYDLCCGN